MQVLCFGELPSAEAQRRFTTWKDRLQTSAGHFAAALAAAGQSTPTHDLEHLEPAMRWVIAQRQHVPEPTGERPLWLAPEADPVEIGWAQLLDALAAWNASVLLSKWPGSTLFLSISKKYGSSDSAHNTWRVGDRTNSLNVDVLDVVYGCLYQGRVEKDMITITVRNQRNKWRQASGQPPVWD